ncbi:hypothetical protein H310_10709 [Aphanomyces invadans]|uniref:Uncharacterized protein n=1 Tax=Aphanomyces invadans TaxID=157072 RepID=A0A024TPW3_9STRA|nr:hypothetical protein H310_10709 [Aphanomyces invadans]ETV96063.1 hypothetical protein H310_10709 [Aphanomyces invadans]|eukprot:XP_008875374.1 hypothetical protein H310_10709 [Aphanomyces invadans]
MHRVGGREIPVVAVNVQGKNIPDIALLAHEFNLRLVERKHVAGVDRVVLVLIFTIRSGCFFRVGNSDGSRRLAKDVGEEFGVVAHEVRMGERARVGLGLGPLAKTKVVELPLKARCFFMVKVLAQDLGFKAALGQDLDRRAVWRPPDHGRVLRLEDAEERSKEFGNPCHALSFVIVDRVDRHRAREERRAI